MNLIWIKTFLTVLETGNYSNAAEVLGYAQSTVTGQMQSLENFLGGIRLLIRSGNRMAPTEAGLAFLPYANTLSETAAEAVQAVSKTREQILRLGTINLLSDTYIPQVMNVLRTAAPDTAVSVIEGRPRELYARLNARELDMMFIIDQRQKHAGFSTRTIREEGLSVVLPKDHPISRRYRRHAQNTPPGENILDPCIEIQTNGGKKDANASNPGDPGDPGDPGNPGDTSYTSDVGNAENITDIGNLSNDAALTFADIRKEALVLTDEGCNFRRFLMDEFKAHDCEPHIVMESQSLAAILNAVSSGWGAAFLPTLLIPSDESLCAIPFASNQGSLTSQIIYRQSELCTHGLVRRIAAALAAA